MKTIGMLGGMSWESTATYYQLINTGIKQHLGGLHSAKIAMISVDFDAIEKLQSKGDWDGSARLLSQAAQSVEAAGADFLVICTNTMHKVAPQIEAALSIPILHIADATGAALTQAGCTRVGLLGTAFTMEQTFYKDRIKDKYGIEVITPNPTDRSIIHRVIYEELCLGHVTSGSRQQYLEIIDQLAHNGAQGVILGCTEISLLVQQQHTSIALFDTAAIHAAAAVSLALR
ncbi:MAG: aspartate/glutamate racemase family protein [Alcanivoracaceae bacterium]|jgi:aspartate racemase|nr:aspartate/glutamate racemase family protein [Alcanivoracaceae bacterium]